MEPERIGKYLRARLLPQPPCRARWAILSNTDDVLGNVAWYGPWRQYTFDPAPRTTFNAACLADLEAYLRRVNVAQRGAG